MSRQAMEGGTDVTGTGSMVDRASAMLVLIDVQERLASAMRRRDAVISGCVLLGRASRVLGIPTIVTRQYPQGLGGVVSEFGEIAEGATVVDKTAFDCTREPAFLRAVEATGRKQVVLAGMEAHICVTQTALSLRAGGYDVHVVADAVCSRRDSDRDSGLDRLRHSDITVTVTESVIYEALGEAGTPEFRAVLALVKEYPVAE